MTSPSSPYPPLLLSYMCSGDLWTAMWWTEGDTPGGELSVSFRVCGKILALRNPCQKSSEDEFSWSRGIFDIIGFFSSSF